MSKKYSAAVIFVFCLLLYSCSKKHHPQNATNATAGNNKEKPEVKRVVIKKIKMTLPNVIIVDDRAALKSADGRLYHDVEGKRYWKNYTDGKYYLFSRNMFADSSFRPH